MLYIFLLSASEKAHQFQQGCDLTEAPERRQLLFYFHLMYKIYGIMKKIYLLAISVCVSLNISAKDWSGTGLYEYISGTQG